MVSLIDSNRQWFKAKIGLSTNETPRDVAFCDYAIKQNSIFQVPDALMDLRFSKNPLVLSEPNIRFYAGMPLTTGNGYNLGTLCVIDRVPQTLNEDQQFALKVLAKQVVHQMEKRRFLAVLEQKNKELKELNKHKDKLLSILTHDLRNPVIGLNTIMSFYKEGEMSKEEINSYFDRLHSQVQNTLGLIENTLNWSQTQLKTDSLSPCQVSLTELVTMNIKLVGFDLEKKNINCTCSLSDSAYVYADPDSIDLIIRNLMQNAVKYCKIGGSIRIAGNLTATDFELTVEDNGIGITDEKLKNLQSDTWQSSQPGTLNERGTGLGLSLYRDYVSKNNGRLDISSIENKGTSVKLILPLFVKS